MLLMLIGTVLTVLGVARAQDFAKKKANAAPADSSADFSSMMAQMKAAKPKVLKRQMDLLNERYDLGDRPAKGVTMSRGINGKLNPKKATEPEMRGQELFFGKAQCATCHPAPYYTDGLMHNLKAERFFKPRMINGRMASADGPIKTFPLRGIKDSPTYLHDGRLITLEDMVEFFNLILELKLAEQEKKDLVVFLRQL